MKIYVLETRVQCWKLMAGLVQHAAVAPSVMSPQCLAVQVLFQHYFFNKI